MKKIAISILCSVGLTLALLAGSVRGQTPIPPPPPPGFIPPTIALPPSIFSTATPPPTATPVPTATATSTATPTSTPIPLTLGVRLAHKTLAPGKKQKVIVVALPGALTHYSVTYPNKHHKTQDGVIGTSGHTSWSYKQPANTTTSKSRIASVRVNVTFGDQHKTSKKSYTISAGK